MKALTNAVERDRRRARRRLRRDRRDDRVQHDRGPAARPRGQHAPARATAKALGIEEFEDDLAAARFNDLSHWGYGTGWGVVRGLLGAAGLPAAARPPRTAPPCGAAPR